MKEPKKKQKIAIIPGLRIGRLEVGDLVYNVREHELYLTTPFSYLQQGRLYQVLCDCGQSRLISESILASGRIQSCGCLRQELRVKSSQAKVERLRKEATKIANNNNIKIEQARLKSLQLTPIRDEKAIEECGAKLRKLFAQKATLNRKETQKETWVRLMKANVADSDPTE